MLTPLPLSWAGCETESKGQPGSMHERITKASGKITTPHPGSLGSRDFFISAP